MLIGFAAILIEIILLFIGVLPIMQSVISFLTINATPFWCLSISHMYYILWPSSVDVSPSPVHLVSARPTMSHFYRNSACVTSLTFPVACKVRTFHVPMVVSFPAIFNCFLPVADFSLPSRGSVRIAVVVIPGLDRSGVISVLIICAFQWVCGLGGIHLVS